MTRPHSGSCQRQPRLRVHDLLVAYPGRTLGRRTILHASGPNQANQLMSYPDMLVGPVRSFQ